jgi:hypothetical protein
MILRNPSKIGFFRKSKFYADIILETHHSNENKEAKDLSAVSEICVMLVLIN